MRVRRVQGGVEPQKTTPVKSRTVQRLIRIAAERAGGRPFDPRQPLSELKNAHATNTSADLRRALQGPYTQLECDVRQELNPPHAMECRHDPGQERGDNLTLAEWLAVGKASRRMLKLDVKEPQHLGAILAEVRRSGVPSERLNWNLDEKAMERWGETLRREFPQAVLSMNPSESRAPLSDQQLQRLQATARRLGPPVNFVVRMDLVDPRVVATLEPIAPVSVWNALGGPKVSDAQAQADRLRALGCSGVIDIRQTPGAQEKAHIAMQAAAGHVLDDLDAVRERFGQVAEGAGRVVEAIRDRTGRIAGGLGRRAGRLMHRFGF